MRDRFSISRGRELGSDGFYYTYQSRISRDILAITDTKERANHYHTWDRLEIDKIDDPGARTEVALLIVHIFNYY